MAPNAARAHGRNRRRWTWGAKTPLEHLSTNSRRPPNPNSQVPDEKPVRISPGRECGVHAGGARRGEPIKGSQQASSERKVAYAYADVNAVEGFRLTRQQHARRIAGHGRLSPPPPPPPRRRPPVACGPLSVGAARDARAVACGELLQVFVLQTAGGSAASGRVFLRRSENQN